MKRRPKVVDLFESVIVVDPPWFRDLRQKLRKGTAQLRRANSRLQAIAQGKSPGE